MSRDGSSDDRRYWLDEPRNVNRLVYVFYAVCAVLLALDLLYHKHVHYGFEDWRGFYGIFGFVACVALVIAAKEVLRRVVMRPEDYYDRSYYRGPGQPGPAAGAEDDEASCVEGGRE